MSDCLDWLKPFHEETQALAAQNAAMRRETDAMQLTRDRLKQIAQSSIKPELIPMMGLTNLLRRTGRTTRLLDEAFRLAKEGKAVYVLGAHFRQSKSLKERFCGLYGRDTAETLGIKFETPGSLLNFDFQTMTLLGAHPNCRVLVDHYAIEFTFARLLQELHRFD